MPDDAPATGGPALPLAPDGPLLIAHNLIDVSPLNPRKAFDKDELQGLADSIAERGLLQNLVLRPHPHKPGRFELVAGERRWRAVALNVKAGKAASDVGLPAIVRPMDDMALMLAALAENVARAELTPLEEGQQFKRLIGTGVDKQAIAHAVGKTVRFVELRLALVEKLAPEAKSALAAGTISLEQARVIAQAPKERQQAIVKEAPKLERADDLRAAVRSVQVPVAAALFDLAEYKGAIVDDDLDPKRKLFGDVAQFTRLQDAALVALKAKLKEKWPWVDVVASYVYHGGIEADYVSGYERATGERAGALILVPGKGQRIVRPVTVTGVIKRDDPKKGGQAQRDYSRAAKPDPAREKARKEQEAFATWCRTFKSHALQRAVLASPALAIAIAVARLEDRWLLDLRSDDPCKEAAAAIKRAGLAGVADDVKVLGKLLDAGAADRAAMLCAAVASSVGVRSANVYAKPALGDHVDDVALLRALAFDPLAGWTIDRAFLDACPMAVMARIQAVLLQGRDASSLKGAILETSAAKTYRPPWLELGTDDELKARLKAKPAAAAGSERRAPTAAKKKGAKR